MPTTNIEGPNSHTSIGTDIGDGVNYASISSTQANRVLETSAGSSAMAATATPSGVLFTNFFNASQIPAGATILGVEVVAGTDFDGSGNSRIGSFGSSTGTFDVECYLHNGTSYSSKLTFDNSGFSGITLSNSDTTAEFDGGNKSYKNNSVGDDVLFGGTSDLAGLSWDPANQANFGFAITFQNESSGMVAGLVRGFGLRVTYQEAATAEKVNSVISGSIAKLDTVVGNTIAKFNGLSLTGAAPPSLFSKQYQFEDQTAQETTGDWSPSLTHSDWVNGTSAVDGTFWGRTSNKTVKGWNCGQDGTPSGTTGPNGGVNPTDGSHVTDSSGENYLYSEVTNNRHLYAFVTRMPGFNFSTEMINTSNNLNLKFWVHAFGSNIGDLYVYIDTNASSNHSTATELLALESFSGYTANSSVWQQQTVGLNSYRATDAVHYIYFVTQNGTGFRGDLAIDNVELIEG
jgi:hypothetical protein